MTPLERKIESELEEWARSQGYYMEHDARTGDKFAEIEPRDLNLTSLARRLADVMTLQLVEPATKSRVQGQGAGRCPDCGSTNTSSNPARCLDCGFGP